MISLTSALCAIKFISFSSFFSCHYSLSWTISPNPQQFQMGSKRRGQEQFNSPGELSLCLDSWFMARYNLCFLKIDIQQTTCNFFSDNSMNRTPFPKPFSCKEKPTINYPCSWTYKVIGSDEAHLRRAIKTLLGDTDLIITPSHTSSGGKYCSLNVELVVEDDETRLKHYQHLKNHAAVKVVL